MNVNDYLRVHELPELRDPIMVAAFAGWNDASQIATYALTTLVQAWSARRFADIDPEEFYDFTEARPTINLGPASHRSLNWPANTFFAHRLTDTEHDVVLLVGVEPQLKWRTFCEVVLHLATQVDASCLVTLGGLLADVPHTLEPRLTGYTTAPRMLPQLQQLGVQMSSYEGPTGILGAVMDAWWRTERPALSLWGNVPHYISATPNPQLSLALLQRVAAVLGVELPLEPLRAQAQAFNGQIDEALEQNPEAVEYVRQLEEHFGQEVPPPAPQLIEELEEFLRRKRPPMDDRES